MKRSWRIWTTFAFCLSVVAAAMAWISFSALRLDRAETAARHRAALEESVRLALWRMDSALAPLVAQESARPYFAYGAFLPVDRAYGLMFNRRRPGETLLPSPLLSEPPPHVLAYFQFEPDGRATSPGVPTGTNYDLAVPRYTKPQAVETTKARIAELEKMVGRKKLLAALPKSHRRLKESVYILNCGRFVKPYLHHIIRGQGVIVTPASNRQCSRNISLRNENRKLHNPVGIEK